MRGFWALPALLRVAVAASQSSFSVQDDVLAFPQYEVAWEEGYVSESQARLRLNRDGRTPQLDTDASVPPGDLATRANDNSRQQRKDGQEYTYEEMMLNDMPYLCRIPIVEPTSAPVDANKTRSKHEEELELARANDRGWELLEGMQGNCIFYWSGWWSYSYCFGEGVKQFHQLPPGQGVPAYPPIEDPTVTGFQLGSVENSLPEDEKGLAKSKPGQASKALGNMEIRGGTRYLVQRLEGGSLCDLTGKSRRIEVQFHCNPATSDKISHIKEVATCAYLMVIQTPRLCGDVAFLPPQEDSPNRISCSLIINPALAAEFKAQLAKEAEAEAEAEAETEAETEAAVVEDPIPNPFEDDPADAPPSIGGIILGAHKWIPKNGKIEKSMIVGGSGREKFIKTIADSSGMVLSNDELKRMGLGDAKAVDQLTKELQQHAGAKAWKLEVFETAQGRQYRGVLLDDDAENEGNSDKDDERSGDAEKEKDQQGSEETYKDEL